MATSPDIPSPSQVPRTAFAPTSAAVPSTDACLNFNTPDGRVICLSVPNPLGEADVAYALNVIQGFVTALARRTG